MDVLGRVRGSGALTPTRNAVTGRRCRVVLRPDVKLFNILVHMLTETNRHAGHADILREQLDGAVGTDAESMALQEQDAAFWANRRAKIERAASAADPARA